MSSAVTALLQRHIQDGGFLGAGVIAAHGMDTALEVYQGEAAPNVAASAETLWPIASISKMFSAAAAMRLIEDGEFTLTSTVSSIVPAFAGGGRDEVRVRHLLTHSSGLPYESAEMETRLRDHTPMQDLLAELLQSDLLFAPGARVAYADYNTLLLGAVASAATGLPFATLVQELVIQPMGLHNTFFPLPESQSARAATVRHVMAEGSSGAMYNSSHARSLAHPAFGVFCTAQDALRFAQHFAPGGPRIHHECTVQAMLQDQTGGIGGAHVSLPGIAGIRIPWGLGWALQTEYTPGLFCDLASQQSFGHGGASGCQLLVDPTNNISVFIATNSHLRAGRNIWAKRLQSVINLAFGETSQRNTQKGAS